MNGLVGGEAGVVPSEGGFEGGDACRALGVGKATVTTEIIDSVFEFIAVEKTVEGVLSNSLSGEAVL